MNPLIKKDMSEIFDRHLNWEAFNNKTVLITGSYGMLASYLVFFFQYLVEEKHFEIQILAQGRNEKKARERFGNFFDDAHFHFLKQNLSGEMHIEGNVDFIIHAASFASPQYYKDFPVDVAEPNAIGTYFLLKLAKEKKVKKFLYFSSGDIYGKVEKNDDIDENISGTVNNLDDHACYSESKRMGETWCRMFFQQYKVSTVIARIAHTYGPTMDLNDTRVFASFMKCILEERPIEMLSDGSAKRPFCYISDATAAFLTLILKGAEGEAYNVANCDEFISIKDLAEVISSLSPKKAEIKYVGNANVNRVENRSNKDNFLNSYKLELLGWKAKVAVQEGFRRTYEYLSSEKH